MKKVYISILASSLVLFGLAQGVGINTTGLVPNASTMLDVASSDKGILIPRVALTSTTDATTISNGNVLSLMVFNTATIADVTPGYYYWDGAVWKTLGGGNDADADPTNEIELPTGGNSGQVLATDGAGNYTWVNDNLGTDNQNITGSSFNATTGDLVIGIQNGTSQTLNFNGLKDHDWYEVGGTTAPDNINDDIYTQGNVGIGKVSPSRLLTNIDAASPFVNVSSGTIGQNSKSLSWYNDARIFCLNY